MVLGIGEDFADSPLGAECGIAGSRRFGCIPAP